MITAAARTYVRSHYVIGLALLAIALGWCALHEHDGAVAARATVQLITHEKDSVVKAYADSVRTASAAIVHDTVRVEHFLVSTRVDTLWKRDTLRLAGDTTLRVAVPLPVIASYDSLGHACQELAGDCAVFRRSATATMSAQASEIAALNARPERSCSLPSLVTGVLGAAGGFYLRGHLP